MLAQVQISSLLKSHVAAGATAGRTIFSLLATKVPTSVQPVVLALDFAGIEIATGSFLREAVLAFRNYCRSNCPAVYPVVANANQAVVEELEYLLKDRGDAIVLCVTTDRNELESARIVGCLEEKQLEALTAVINFGAADAQTLMAYSHSSQIISINAWNNRLAALNNKGILVETKQGRRKIYRPVLEGLTDGR